MRVVFSLSRNGGSPFWGEKGKQKEHVSGNEMAIYLGVFTMGSI